MVAAAVPIVLHLLRREAAPPVPFSAVRFLNRAPVEQTARRRLRGLMVLALRVGALLLLAFAFARPYSTAGAVPPGHLTIVAVDTSFSMGAPGQFAEARIRAHAAIDAVPAATPVGVVAFDDRAIIVAKPSIDHSAARSAVDRLVPGAGSTRYRTMINRIAEIVGTQGATLVIVTDLQRAGWDADGSAALPEGVTIDLRPVEAPTGNLAISRVTPGAGEVVATVANGGGRDRSALASLLVNGRRAATQQFTAPASSSVVLRFVTALPDEGVGMVEVDDSDGYVADNTRYFALDGSSSMRVAVVTSTGEVPSAAFYLERALLAAGDSRQLVVETVASQALPSRGQDALRSAAVVILLSTRGLDRRAEAILTARVREGAGLLVAAGPSVDPAFVNSLLADQEISLAPAEDGTYGFTPVDARHPIFRPLGALGANLGQIRLRRIARLSIGDAGRAIARFHDGGPALVEASLGHGRVLIFGSDLGNAWNDFPLHSLFAPFVHETVRYLARDQRTIRDAIIGSDSEGIGRQPGVVTVGLPRRRVAVNVDPIESAPAVASEDEFRSAVIALTRAPVGRDIRVQEAAGEERGQALWRYGLAIMVIVLAGEGLLARRMTRTE